MRTPISDRRAALLALGTGIFGALFALCSLFIFRRTFEQDLMTVIVLFYTSLFFLTLLHRYLDQRAFSTSAGPRTVA